MSGNRQRTNRSCTTMATLKKRCLGGPLIPQSSFGLVRFLTIPNNIRGFRYTVHDQVVASGIRLTEEGRKLCDEFHAKIGYDPMRLLTIQQAVEIVERSREYWFEAVEF